MELFFLALLVLLMATALGSGYPVAFALPGSAIITIALAAITGYVFAGDSAAYFAQGSPFQWLSAGVTNFRGVYWEVERDTLIAIPLFVFMGIMLQRSKIAEDLLVTMAQLFGPVPGGLGISVVFVGALLAATTGIVGATVVAMGLISLPAMLRNNYSQSLATGTIAASGTLGQIIPPSIVLIILADQLASAVDQASTARQALYKATTGEFSMPSEFGVISTSAGDMFLGAFIPGLVLVGLYMTFILVISLLRPSLAPAVNYEGAYDRKFAFKVLLVLVPPLALIFVVLGSIIAGIATVNQAGAIGAVGATIMAGYRLKEGDKGAYHPAILSVISLVAIFTITANFNTNIKNISTSSDVVGITLAITAVAAFLFSVIWSGWRTFKIEDTMRGVMVETAKTTSLVFIILLGAAMLTAAFRAFGGEELVREFLTSLPGGFWAQFVIVMMVIFVLGFFLDFIEIAVVVVPIVAPILLADPSANITAVWLGVMIGLNIQTSFLTPPFGFALFYLRGVAPAVVKTINMYKGVVAFIALQLIALGIVGFVPHLVNYLPTRISLTSDTAPPPLNPRLQHCMEKLVFAEYSARGVDIRKAIDEAKKLDISYLPKKLQKNLKTSFDQAAGTFDLLDKIDVAEKAVAEATPAYKPLHIEVRGIQARIRKIDAELKELTTRISRLKRLGDEGKATIAKVGHEVEELNAERKEIEGQIPANWKDDNAAFAKLKKAELASRSAYRRNVDGAYGEVAKVVEMLDDADALAALKGRFDDLVNVAQEPDAKAAGKKISTLSSDVSKVAGTSTLRSRLKTLRRAVSAKTRKPEQIEKELKRTQKALADDLVWRERAAKELSGGLKTYEAEIRNTIGLRLQSRLPEDKALEIAACNSGHRDISLSF
ncbi:MAG: TRAP transporter large permease subunit [Hyphomicrobiales bacterium]